MASMSRIAVVTSSPPMVEGGHMVIARSLVQALRAAGHDAEVVVTPQNRFGRQAVGVCRDLAHRRRLERWTAASIRSSACAIRATPCAIRATCAG